MKGNFSVWTIALPWFSNFYPSVFSIFSFEKCFDICGLCMNRVLRVPWTKKFTIRPLQRLDRALGFRQNGEFLLESGGGQMISYNLDTQQVKGVSSVWSFSPRTFTSSFIHRELGFGQKTQRAWGTRWFECLTQLSAFLSSSDNICFVLVLNGGLLKSFRHL